MASAAGACGDDFEERRPRSGFASFYGLVSLIGHRYLYTHEIACWLWPPLWAVEHPIQSYSVELGRVIMSIYLDVFPPSLVHFQLQLCLLYTVCRVSLSSVHSPSIDTSACTNPLLSTRASVSPSLSLSLQVELFLLLYWPRLNRSPSPTAQLPTNQSTNQNQSDRPLYLCPLVICAVVYVDLLQVVPLLLLLLLIILMMMMMMMISGDTRVVMMPWRCILCSC